MRNVSTLFAIGIALAASSALHAQDTNQAAVAVCLTCHGPGAETADPAPGAPPIPRLEGQHAEYLVKQLREFKAGKRNNDLMVPILAGIRAGQFPALAAHFAGQPVTRQTSTNAALVERGRSLYEQGNANVPACIGCHLENGVGAPKYPRLAGQRQPYVVQQLTNFKSGRRTNDRAHVMRSIAANLSDDDMRALAEYLASL